MIISEQLINVTHTLLSQHRPEALLSVSYSLNVNKNMTMGCLRVSLFIIDFRRLKAN